MAVSKAMALALPPPTGSIVFARTPAARVLSSKGVLGRSPFALKQKGLALKPIYEGGLKPINVRQLVVKDAFGVARETVGKGIVGSFLDRRAAKVVTQLAPVGSKLANGAEISGHVVSRGRFGSRKVATSISREGKEIGQVKAIVSPTKHVGVTNAKIAPGERGKGVGTSALKTITDNAPKAKTPGVYWWSQGNGGSSGYTGARAWKHGDAEYVRGAPFLPGSVDSALRGSTEAARKQGKKFARRARLGLVKPSDMPTKAPEEMQGLPWAAKVRGGQPFGRKTMIGAGGAGAVATEETVRRKR